MNLNQITIPSTNVPKAIGFYQTLGLTLIVHTHDQYARFELPEGDATFSIHEVASLPEAGVIVYFEVKNVAEKVKELTGKGIAFTSQATLQSWGWTEASFVDLDGNQLILYTAGNFRKNPPWRLQTNE